jgi:uncharacterized protein
VSAYWLALGLAALLVGFAKTSIGGLGSVAVALFASVMPARESTAAVLLLLLMGDLIAVGRYRRSCDWQLMRQLLPAVLPGVLLGTAVLAVVGDSTLKRLIGVVIATLVVLQLAMRKVDLPPWALGRGAGHVAGAAAGFATMTANSAGPVMTLFLVSHKVDKLRFLGTAAWFFLLVNVAKVPFSAALGLFSVEMFSTALVLAPLVALGGLLGIAVARRLRQSHFDVVVLVASGVSAVSLLVS